MNNMSYPYNLETKTITGRFADLYQDRGEGEVKTRPREGYVYITPYYDKIKVLDIDTVVDLYELQRQRVKMKNGEFTAEVLVTNQSNISPGADANGHGWTYKFEMSWMDGYEANIPIDADSSEVLDINDYFESPERPGLIVTKGDAGEDGQDGADGRGITVITANGPVATIQYTDGTSSTIPLPAGGSGGYQYVHNQIAAEKDWVIEHGLNKYITGCFVMYGTNLNDTGADQVLANWSHVDENTIIVHHGAACSGRAVI